MDIQIQPHEEEEEREIVVPSRELVVPDREIVPASASEEIVRSMVVDGVAKCWTNGGAGNPAALLSSNRRLYEGDPKTNAYVWAEYPVSPEFVINAITNNSSRGSYLNLNVEFDSHHFGAYGKVESNTTKYAEDSDGFFDVLRPSGRFTSYNISASNQYGFPSIRVTAPASKFPPATKVHVGEGSKYSTLNIDVGLGLTDADYCPSYYAGSTQWGRIDHIYKNKYDLTLVEYIGGWYGYSALHQFHGMYEPDVREGSSPGPSTKLCHARYSDTAKGTQWAELELKTSFGSFTTEFSNVPLSPLSYGIGHGKYESWHNIEFTVDLANQRVYMLVMRRGARPSSITVVSTQIPDGNWRYDV